VSEACRPGSSCGVFAAAFSLLMTGAGTAGLASAQDLRIEHVNIVSPKRERPLRDVTFSIHEGRIVRISGTGARTPPGTTRSDVAVVEGRGLYLSPCNPLVFQDHPEVEG
jgi:hypothetical protein